MTVIITECSNAGSYREGTKKTVKSLRGAKMSASRGQCFYGTVLTIEAENGELLSLKNENGWSDQ